MIHKEADRLYAAVGDRDFIDYESKHRQIITQFGRYPQRNAAMGRASTPQEKEWLKLNEGFETNLSLAVLQSQAMSAFRSQQTFSSVT